MSYNHSQSVNSWEEINCRRQEVLPKWKFASFILKITANARSSFHPGRLQRKELTKKDENKSYCIINREANL